MSQLPSTGHLATVLRKYLWQRQEVGSDFLDVSTKGLILDTASNECRDPKIMPRLWAKITSEIINWGKWVLSQVWSSLLNSSMIVALKNGFGGLLEGNSFMKVGRSNWRLNEFSFKKSNNVNKQHCSCPNSTGLTVSYIADHAQVALTAEHLNWMNAHCCTWDTAQMNIKTWELCHC